MGAAHHVEEEGQTARRRRAPQTGTAGMMRMRVSQHLEVFLQTSLTHFKNQIAQIFYWR
ncbi:hypothetical protein DPMN_173444 [Dreissena polymorpha]|uniref:Uncharacterized protein n=1 Tax=Dreissena polymorpha TaxID=45954 RepID=A0A9D4E4M7_DREPO|nr:hypothetical protein DPMN_173444 [Dreissena polymorpha]